MKVLISLILILFVCSCSNSIKESDNRNKKPSIKNIIKKNELKFSLKNDTPIEMKEITVGLPGKTLRFERLKPKTQTEWVSIKSAYSYGYLQFYDENDTLYTLTPIDYVGEKLYKNGKMTHIITKIDPSTRWAYTGYTIEKK